MAMQAHESPDSWRTPRGPVLLIEPDPSCAIGMVRALSPLARVRLASGLADGLVAAALECPELVLVSDALPDADLATLRQAWLQVPALAGVPMVALLSQADEQAEIAALDAGALACVPRHAGPALIRSRMRATLDMVRTAADWRQSAQSDALTGLASRRHLDAVMQREWRRAQRAERPLALLMVDVDHFKAYNDWHGHPAGDDCLRELARVLRLAVRRPTDLVGRFGGEEFVVLLSETDGHGGLIVGHMLRQALIDRAYPHGAPGAGARVSVSIGVSAWKPGQGDPGVQALLSGADAALFDAKRQGRDSVAWRSLPAFDDATRAARQHTLFSRAPAPGTAMGAH